MIFPARSPAPLIKSRIRVMEFSIRMFAMITLMICSTKTSRGRFSLRFVDCLRKPTMKKRFSKVTPTVRNQGYTVSVMYDQASGEMSEGFCPISSVTIVMHHPQIPSAFPNIPPEPRKSRIQFGIPLATIISGFHLS